MPAYRVTEYIAEALESLFAQTVQDFEVIVVNDGCPDTANLERVLEPYRDRIRYIRQPNAGVAAARNTAIRAARGEFISQLDPDDAWEPHHLETQLAMFRDHPTADVVYPDMAFFGDTLLPGGSFMDLYPSRGEVSLSSVLRRICTPSYAVTARRNAVLAAGLFDPELHRGEDLDLWLRILYRGGHIVYHRHPTVRYRCRSGSLTADPVRTAEYMVAVLTKAQRTMSLTGQDLECLNEALRREQAWLDFARGKRAFFEGDVSTAREQLASANVYFRSRKTALILFLLRWAPGLMRRAARLRYRQTSLA